MTPHYSDDWLTLYGGDCREVLAALPADSVDCVVTSPPYWGLRDYGTATWEGGDAECDHKNTNWDRDLLNDGGNRDRTTPMKDRCRKCGATRIDSQLGLERTPEEYVANMVAVFREVRRVLKPSGTCWLNLGDSYAGGNDLGRNDADRNFTGGGGNHAGSGNPGRQGTHERSTGLKPKDLVGIPWRVAFALQADGWYLRSDIIWSKPNPMPESVTDRPTKSHEYLFLLTKSARYYFDADAVREPHVETSGGFQQRRERGETSPAGTNGMEGGKYGGPVGALPMPVNPAGRNIRSVWTIATRPYPGAHFAVFPPELPERCIKAGSSEKGVCPECGAPWERRIEQSIGDTAWSQADQGLTRRQEEMVQRGERRGVGRLNRGNKAEYYANAPQRQTTGWRQPCDCWETFEDGDGGIGLRKPEPEPAVILDPFGGSGTVGMVANRLSRRAILIDLNPEYLKQQMTRNSQVPLGLTEGDAA